MHEKIDFGWGTDSVRYCKSASQIFWLEEFEVIAG